MYLYYAVAILRFPKRKYLCSYLLIWLHYSFGGIQGKNWCLPLFLILGLCRINCKSYIQFITLTTTSIGCCLTIGAVNIKIYHKRRFRYIFSIIFPKSTKRKPEYSNVYRVAPLLSSLLSSIVRWNYLLSADVLPGIGMFANS